MLYSVALAIVSFLYFVNLHLETRLPQLQVKKGMAKIDLHIATDL